MPEEIYILAPDGTPLMPTKRKRHIDALVKAGEARIVSRVPIVVQMLYEVERNTQPLYYATDPGRTNIGVAVIKEDGTCVFLAECLTCNKQIRKLMEKRKACRMASRRGERKARQRLAVKHATIVAGGTLIRILPGCEEPITCKFIKNTEARFLNRKRPAGWLTPTANHLLQTHINLLEKISKFLPITGAVTEVNRFSFASMENPDLKGVDFQNGPLKGYDDVDEAVYASQKGICLLCGKRHITRYHHIVPRSQGGSDTLPNKAGLCEVCHDAVHKDSKAKNKLASIKAGMNKKYGALSVLNQIIPYWAEYLIQRFGDNAYFVEGWQTAEIRSKLDVVKDRDGNPCHSLDAYLMGLIALGIEPKIPDTHTYFIKQYRRHDRAIIYAQKERTYKLNDKVVAKNRRKRTDQHEDSLHEFYVKLKRTHGKVEACRICSGLKVLKSTRSYNNPNRVMPGAEFLYQGERYVLRGQKDNGRYYFAEGMGNTILKAKECIVIKSNTGLVFLK